MLYVLVAVLGDMFFGQRFLRAESEAAAADIGIPGISKWYSVALINPGFLPVRVAACDVTTDAGQEGVEVANAIEKWDEGSRRWTVFWRIPRTEFCKHSFDIQSAQLTHHWLWPGKRFVTGAIAIQASDGLALGDHLRYKVFPGTDEETEIASPAFVVDERPSRTLTPQ